MSRTEAARAALLRPTCGDELSASGGSEEAGVNDTEALVLAAQTAFDAYNARIGRRTRMTDGQAKEVARAVCEAVLEMMPHLERDNGSTVCREK